MKHFYFHTGEQAALEAVCKEATERATDGGAYFVAVSADAKGHGHCLCQVTPDGEVVKHWGSVDEHIARLTAKKKR